MDNFLLIAIPFLLSVLFALKLYGIYLGFKAKWYLGLLAIFVPWVAVVAAIGKVVFKKDLLE